MSVEKPSGSLAPVDWQQRKWSRTDAKHLLWRTQFGASAEQIARTHTDGSAKSLERLFSLQPESTAFVAADELLRRAAMDTDSPASLKAWWLHRLFHSVNPLPEKMALFWHNHFATSIAKVRSASAMAAQNDLCRREALGSFRRLLHGMTRDGAMLVWLDGNANRRRHANENFAREIMELFALGEGHYSEKDIKEAARAFTGWHVREGQFWFNRDQHDFGIKTVFGKMGDFDGGAVVDLCLAQKACPRFLAAKLLRAFVLPQPAEAIVAAVAARVRAHDFAMGEVLRELLASELFHSDEARGALIKSPIELALGALRALEGQPNLRAVHAVTTLLGQDIFQPPTVKGWEGGRLWITSASLLQRANFAATLTGSNQLGAINAPEISARKTDTTPAQIVAHYTDLLLARPPAPETRLRLESYAAASTGETADRIRGLLHLIMAMPEFQLM